MSTKESTVNYILEQISQAGAVRAKKMFGEYCIYCDDKVVALVCDNELFVKLTKAGEAYLGEYELKPAYPGAKPSFHISGDKWDDAEWLTQLITISSAELPKPKPKKKR
ncbi:MAG: competence protein TfoX [Legionellaceae bacterium]|nr:competence protein TfoX [Legionellaceae bacterium]